MNCLVFGANGSIGKYVFDSFIHEKYNVIGTTTKFDKINDNIIYVDNNNLYNLDNINSIDIIVWAQGQNFNDNIINYDIINFNEIMNANL